MCSSDLSNRTWLSLTWFVFTPTKENQNLGLIHLLVSKSPTPAEMKLLLLLLSENSTSLHGIKGDSPSFGRLHLRKETNVAEQDRKLVENLLNIIAEL